MTPISEILHLCAESTDDELFLRLEAGSIGERSQLVETLAVLAELHKRRASLRRGHSSLYSYCTKKLGYCERTAYKRIAAARLGARYPAILEALQAGSLHLTAVELIGRYFTPDNHQSLLARAIGATLEDLKRLAASLAPAEDAPAERTRIIALVARAGTPENLFTHSGHAEDPAESGRPRKVSPNQSRRREVPFSRCRRLVLEGPPTRR